jgi:hypothetical protein
VQTTAKKSSKFTKKNHICRWYDDTQPCKISFVQTRLRLWDIKITNFKSECCPDDLLEICKFVKITNFKPQHILQGCVSSYHLHMSFFVNLDDFFTVVCTGFHEGCDFHLIRCLSEQGGRIVFFALN